MAVSTPVLATPNVGVTGTSVTTASFTPTAGATLIAFAIARGASALIPTLTDSLGNTWTALDAGHDAGFVLGRLFRLEVGASPAARTVTVASTSATQVAVSIISVTGAGTDFSNYQFDITTGTSQSVTMQPYQAGSIVLSGYVDNSGVAQTPPSGFTELFDSNVATNVRASIAYDDGATASTSLAWVTGASDNFNWALEIKEPVAANHDFNDYAEPNSPFLVSPYPAAGDTIEELYVLFGTEFADRVIAAIVVVNDAASTVVPLSSVTIGGVPATVTAVGGVSNGYIVSATVPTGVDGDIVFTPETPGTINKLEGLGVFALSGVDPDSAVAGAVFSGTSVTFDVPAGGQAFAYFRGTGNHIGELTGLDLDGDQWTVDDRILAWGSRTFTSAVTGHTASLVDDSGNLLMVWAVFSEAVEPTGSVVKVQQGGVMVTGVVRAYLGGVWVAKPLKTFKGTDWY